MLFTFQPLYLLDLNFSGRTGLIRVKVATDHQARQQSVITELNVYSVIASLHHRGNQNTTLFLN
jgi:hypothetical protein